MFAVAVLSGGGAHATAFLRPVASQELYNRQIFAPFLNGAPFEEIVRLGLSARNRPFRLYRPRGAGVAAPRCVWARAPVRVYGSAPDPMLDCRDFIS